MLYRLRTRRPRRSRRWPVIPSLVVVALIAVVGPTATSAATYPSNTTYYIDNSGGSGCSNANTGTSSSAPWCDFANVNGSTFAQGDQILLRSGDTWNQALSPAGSGVSGNPITIGCFPSTSCATYWPVVRAPNTSTDAISITNGDWWTINQVTINQGANGIHFNFTTLNHQGYVLQNVYITGTGQGIVFDGFNQNPQYTVPSGNYIYSNVTISTATVTNQTKNGIEFVADYPMVQTTSSCCTNAQQNIVVKDVTVTNIACGALGLANASHVKMLGMYVDNADTSGCSGAANYIVAVDDAVWANGIFNNTPWTNANDNPAFNLDNHVTGLRWRGSYFRGNYGSALEWTENPCFHTCTSTTDTGAEISSNAFTMNSRQNSPSFYGDIDNTYAPYATGTAQDNLYYDVPQTYNTFAHNSLYTLTNNVSVSSDGNLYNGGYQFSSTQGTNGWTYTSNAATGSFANMSSYSSTTGVWTDGLGGFVSRFDMVPPTNSLRWVAKVWTAPRAGTINIRGWILKNELGGDGVQAAIAGGLGGSWIWQSVIGANDQVGTSTNVSNVSVTAGEEIMFCLNDGGWNGGTYNNSYDMVSWSPSVAYTG